MADFLKHLSEAELDIMRIIWSVGSSISALTILEQLKEIRPWSLQTLYTALSRLESKGYIVCDKKGRNKVYTTNIDENRYKQLEGRSFLNRVFESSVKNMVMSLYQGKALNPKDLSELRDFLNELEGDAEE